MSELNITQLIRDGYKDATGGLRGKYKDKRIKIDAVTLVIFANSRKKDRLTVTTMYRHVQLVYNAYNSNFRGSKVKVPTRNIVNTRMEQLYSMKHLDRVKEVKEDGYKRWIYYDPSVAPRVGSYDRGGKITVDLYEFAVQGIEIIGDIDPQYIEFLRDSESGLSFPSHFYELSDMIIDRARYVPGLDVEGVATALNAIAKLLNVEIK